MKILKASIAAALLVMPASFGAFAATTTTASYVPGAPSVYGSYNPSNPGYGGVANPYTQAGQGPMVPGQVQQYYNNIMALPGTTPPGQQGGVFGNNFGQAPPPPVQYHYKNPNPNNGSIPDDQLPQRLFHNIPPQYYGALGDR